MTRAKKNSIIDFPDDFIVLDIETTGLSPEYDSVIEVSAIKISGKNTVSKFTSLVKPEYTISLSPSEYENYLYLEDGTPYYYVCNFITNLTGITNEMLENAPNPKDVFHEFYTFINNSIIVGHNIGFDINFLKNNFKELFDIDFECNYIDTMRVARKLFKDERHHRLRDVASYLEIPLDDSSLHRSLYDCEITCNCYKLMYDKIISEFESIQAFIDLFDHKKYYYDPRSLLPETTEIDETNPFFNKECIFTGVLDKMVRKDAQQIVVNFGGSCGKSVTQKTNYLILGNNDYCKSIKDGKSIKHKKAEDLKVKGFDIEIMSEDVFYDLIGLEL